MLPIIFKRIAGLDVHKKTVVATRMRVVTQEEVERDQDLWNHDTGTVGVARLVVRVGADPRGDGEHGRLLEAGVQHP